MLKSLISRKSGAQQSVLQISILLLAFTIFVSGCTLGPKNKIKRGASDIEKIIIKFDKKIIEFEDEKIDREKLDELVLIAYNKIGFIVNDLEGFVASQPLKKKDEMHQYFVSTFDDLNERLHTDFTVAMGELKIESFHIFMNDY